MITINAEQILSTVKSLCPECLKTIDADIYAARDNVYMIKRCPEHGIFDKILLWEGNSGYLDWTGRSSKLESPCNMGCQLPDCMRRETNQKSAYAMLEVTGNCNLSCRFCYAVSQGLDKVDPSFATVKNWLNRIAEYDNAVNLIIGGGEPTLREDLPEIIAYAKKIGFPYVQLNTNGVRIADDMDYLCQLKEAGLDVVFLQFEGTDGVIYRKLCGRSLLDTKQKAIAKCAACGIGVILVPKLIKGVNDDNIGDIMRLGLSLIPHIRGIHFRPTAWIGRCGRRYNKNSKISMPALLEDIEKQTNGIFKKEYFSSSCYGNSLCSFHGNFLMSDDRRIISVQRNKYCCDDDNIQGVEVERNYSRNKWVYPCSIHDNEDVRKRGQNSLDILLDDVRRRTFSVSAMFFQDVWDIDLCRTGECNLRIFDEEYGLIPFCVYNITSVRGKQLYRRSKGS